MILNSLIQGRWLDEMAAMAAQTPAGCFVEVGVYQGGSAQRLYHVARDQKRKLHLFDTFTGIPFQGKLDHHKVGDFGDANLGVLLKVLPQAAFHVGVFPNTLPPDLKDIAFIHADVDQYESQKAINKHLWPLVVPNGIMLLDDYYHLSSIRQAVDEDFGEQLVRPDNGRPYIVKT